MKRRNFLILTGSSFVILPALNSCNQQQVQSAVLTVSAAGVYRDILAEIDKIYKQDNPNNTITYNIAGSGFLRKQIEQGAPVDIYIPGVAKEMDTLQAQGLVVTDTRLNLTKNSIVLITHKDSNLAISSFKDLTKQQIKRVALGSEKVSAGIYTGEVLKFFDVYERVKTKGVYAEEDIRQVLKQVETKTVDVGITYGTEPKLSNLVKVIAIAPEKSHTPVISPIAVLKKCQHISAAQEFINFLDSDKVAPIFEKYGFTKFK